MLVEEIKRRAGASFRTVAIDTAKLMCKGYDSGQRSVTLTPLKNLGFVGANMSIRPDLASADISPGYTPSLKQHSSHNLAFNYSGVLSNELGFVRKLFTSLPEYELLRPTFDLKTLNIYGPVYDETFAIFNNRFGGQGG